MLGCWETAGSDRIHPEESTNVEEKFEGGAFHSKYNIWGSPLRERTFGPSLIFIDTENLIRTVIGSHTRYPKKIFGPRSSPRPEFRHLYCFNNLQLFNYRRWSVFFVVLFSPNRVSQHRTSFWNFFAFPNRRIESMKMLNMEKWLPYEILHAQMRCTSFLRFQMSSNFW